VLHAEIVHGHALDAADAVDPRDEAGPEGIEIVTDGGDDASAQDRDGLTPQQTFSSNRRS
jgi:hypothetical protein